MEPIIGLKGPNLAAKRGLKKADAEQVIPRESFLFSADVGF